jgi:regulator of sigma E protease
MSFILSKLMEFAIFLLILSVLIFIHELGHFLAAKRLKIRVEKFSLGFGPKLFSRKVGETEYMLCAIPFGGFIKMAGDSAREHRGERFEFLSRRPGERAQIVFAGPFFNYVLAFFCLWAVFYLGYPRVTSKIGDLIPRMPAERAGLLADDRITAVDGTAVVYWDDLTKLIHKKKDQDVRLTVVRADKTMELTLSPEMRQVETIWGKQVSVSLIGIKPSEDVILVRYGLFDALVRGTKSLLQMTALTVTSIFYIIIGTMSFKESVTGPLGIFSIVVNAAKMGISPILHVIGVLSMSLAIFNLLPLPILDGGHIALAGLEKIRRRPITPKTEDVLTNIGMSFMILLAVFILCNDIVRQGYWDKFLAFFHK